METPIVARKGERAQSERFVKVPVAVLNDPRLSDVAFRAYAVLLDCNRDGRSKISFPGLAKRLAVSDSTAQRIIRKLTDLGYAVNRETASGKCASYEVFPTLVRADHGTLVTRDTGTLVKKDAYPSQMTHQTLVTGDQESIRSLNYSLDAHVRARGDSEKKTTEDDELSNEIVTLLTDCLANGKTAEIEAARLLRRHPHQRTSLPGHLRFAIAKRIANPVAYADQQAQRGETPLPVPAESP
jgi:DNA-binding Lrp family transcriptional regulator